MLQNMRNQPDDGQENSAGRMNEMQEIKNHEGFEGMNYEQSRQPYYPRHTGSSNGNNNGGNSKHHEEI